MYTYNCRSLKREAKLYELVEELKGIKWGIIGLSETWRKGISCQVLNNGCLFYTNGFNDRGGTGFLVNNYLKNSVLSFKTYTHRVSKLTIKVSESSSERLRLLQVYAPTSAASDEELEDFYDYLMEALEEDPCKFTIIMGDWNAKVGMKATPHEWMLGRFGVDSRNERGARLIEFCQTMKLYVINSFFQKPFDKKWTWVSPDGLTFNEIDLFLSNHLSIFKDVEASQDFNIGSDHQPVKAKVNITVGKTKKAKSHGKTIKKYH